MYHVRNPDGSELTGLTESDVCAAIIEGRIAFDAIASTDETPGFVPVANLAPFRRAFEARLAAPDDTPPLEDFGPFVDEGPTPESSANLVVPVDEPSPTIAHAILPVPGLIDTDSDEHDRQTNLFGARQSGVETLDDEGHDTIVQGASVETTTKAEVFDEGRDLDTLVGGTAHDDAEVITDATASAPGVEVSSTDIHEVQPNDTQLAVVHPEESFEPEDLALTSQDDPMPPVGPMPPADPAPIGHGGGAWKVARERSPHAALACGVAAWALLFAVLFSASVATGGGRAEAIWRPNSAVLWLRIALTGGLGALLVFAFRRSLPLSRSQFRLSWEWAGIAVLAGLSVGAMAPFDRSVAPVGVAIVLGATLAIAEEAFFRGFLGRVLATTFPRSRAAIGIAALLYGAYYSTYFVIWEHDKPVEIALALTMITVGAALPYAILQDLTKGFLAPLLCHVFVNVAGVVSQLYF